MVDTGNSHRTGTSRRRLFQLGAVAAGGALLGAQGALLAHADPSDHGGDGAPPPLGSTTPQRGLAAADLGTTSYNGWTVGTPGSVIGVQSFTVPGTSVVLGIRSGDVATVLQYVAQRFNAEVEPLLRAQCGGYEYRPNVNNPSVWSNHASGTAIDLNWEKHPNGAPNTFTAGQTAAVRAILAACGRVVYWGQDYRGTVDGMHFEINVPPGNLALTQLAAKIRSGGSTAYTSGIDAYQDNAGVRHIFGVTSAGRLLEVTDATGQWQTRDVSNNGYIVGTPAVAYRNGRCDAFVIGLDASMWTMHRWDGGGWSGWSPIGGARLTGGLHAVIADDGSYHVFCVTTTGELFQVQGYPDLGWDAQNISNRGYLLGTPTGTYRNGRLDAFGIGLDGAVWQQTYISGAPAWTPWNRVGGSGLVGGLDAARDANGTFRVLGVDVSSRLLQFTSTNGASWTSKDISNQGLAVGVPTLMFRSGRVETYVVGLDGQGWVQSSASSGPWSGWGPLGGDFR